MASITTRSIKRNADKVAKKNNAQPTDSQEPVTISKSNIPFLPPMNTATFIASVDAEQAAEVKAGEAKAHRIYNALLLALNDPAIVAGWSQHWAASQLPVNAANTQRRNEANAYFDNAFSLPDPAKLDREALKARNLKRGKLMEGVQFCLQLHLHGRLQGTFEFNDKGMCFLLTNSTIGKRACEKRGWDKAKAFMDSGDNIKLVSSKVDDRGYLSWAELDQLVRKPEPTVKEVDGAKVSDTEETLPGSKPKDLRQRDFSDPLKVMSEAIIEMQKQSDTVPVSTQHALNTLARIEDMVAFTFKAAVFANALSHFNVFAKDVRDVLKAGPRPPREAMGTGKVQPQPIRPVQMVTPPEVAKLPLAQPAKVAATVVTAAELIAHRKAKAKTVPTKAKKRARR